MKCPECGGPEIVCEAYTFGFGESARCINCGFSSTNPEEFAGEESMDEQVVILPTEEARLLIFNIQQHEEQKAQLITKLQEQRQQIEQALIDLGAKRKRRKSDGKRRGRPPGSKNKVATFDHNGRAIPPSIGGEAA